MRKSAGVGLAAVLTTALSFAAFAQNQDAQQNQGDQGTQGEQEQGMQQGQPTGALPTSIDKNQALQLIQGWPDASQKAAKAMIDKYGSPNGYSDRMLVWYDNGPWKKTEVFRDGATHNFPSPHQDVLLQTINYKVPIGKFDMLQRFDGSLVPNRTQGTLSSIGDSEEHNILALNLANDVITGKRNVADARNYFARTEAVTMAGKTSPYVDKLQFKGKSSTADPDRQVKVGGGSQGLQTPDSEQTP